MKPYTGIDIKFNPHDLWIGVFWQTYPGIYQDQFSVYICLVPMFPIHVWWLKTRTAIHL